MRWGAGESAHAAFSLGLELDMARAPITNTVDHTVLFTFVVGLGS